MNFVLLLFHEIGSMGVLEWNTSGSVLKEKYIRSSSKLHILRTSTMEALALWEAAIMASFCSSQSIFIGGDAQALIN